MGHREFRFGDWQVDVEGNALSDGATRIPLEPRAMEVLRYLCRHPGAVIPAEELLQACWGSAEFGDNPVHKAITQLRRALGDSSTEPRYIETIRKRGYRAIAEVVEAEEDGQLVWTGGSPFRGLEPFQENHAAIFFGRVQATARLKELVEKQTLAGRAMALILGPSGSGKTSLVRAGLMPQLMQSVATEDSPIALNCTLYLDCADLGEGSLFHALAAVLLDAEFNNHPFFLGESAESLGKKLEHGNLAEIFKPLSDHKRPVVGLFIDRLEAIFRAKDMDDEARERFIDLLEILAAEKGMLVMMACRNDFYPEIIALPGLMALKAIGGHFDLTAPDGADIAQIIRLPAKAAQLTYETDLTSGANLDDLLCDAARGSPDTLPLLQYCLNELYRQRSENGVLRFEVFQQLGGIEGAIGMRAEQIITGLNATKAAALPKILSLLVNIGDEQSAVTARSVAWSMLRSDDERDLVRAMIEARLFVSELAGDVPSFGVAHEALLRRWPRVVAWIEQHCHALQLRTRVSSQADRWQIEGRSKDLLLPKGLQITQVRSLLENKALSLSALEQEFIRSSIRKAKLGERTRLSIIILVMLLAALSIVLGAMAKSSQRQAEQHRGEVEGLLGFMLNDFTEKLRPLGRLDLLDDVSKKALLYLSATMEDNPESTSLRQRAKVLQIIAEVNISRAKTDQALEALTIARSILKKEISKHPNDSDILKNLGENAFWLGQIHFDRNELKKAKIFLNDYKNYSDKLFQINPSDVNSWIEQSYAHNSLGSLFMKEGLLETAITSFEHSAQLKQKALISQPNNQTLIAGLANSLSWQASAKARLGRLAEAMLLYKKEENILKPFSDISTKNSTWVHRLAMAIWRQGDLKIALGDQKNAIEDLREAEKLLQGVLRLDSSNLTWKVQLYAIQLKILATNANEGSLPKTDLPAFYKLSSEILDLEKIDSKRIDFLQLQGILHQTLAIIFFKKKEIAQSVKHIDESINNLRKISKENSTIKGILAESLLIKSELDDFLHKKEISLSSCKYAQDILASEKDKTQDYYLLSPIVKSYICTGDYNLAKNQAAKLEKMAYREVRYHQYLHNHLHAKGN